ncbi:MAG: amidohydrolase family protein [Clostridiales bacterium]|nr:amidohydrolase family protein [Clostridiales bacterium]
MKAIINTDIVMEDHIIWDGVILYDKDRIIAADSSDLVSVPEGAKLIDAKGKYTAPGFVDIHNHGTDGMFNFEYPEEVSEYFLKRGTTTMLACIFYTVGLDGYLKGIETVKSHMGKGYSRIIPGFYMEGPYMNSKYGADSKNNKWNHPITESEYKQLVDEAGDLAKVWCVAPEREGIEEFCAYAKSVNPNVIFSAGHSEAKPHMLYNLKKYGLKSQTHHMNATGVVNPLCPGNDCGIRDCGPDEAVLYDDDIYAELIADSMGIHVKPHNIRMVSKIKGVDRIILITDSYPIGFPPPKGPFERATDLGFDSEGGLCGSKMTMDMACRNMIQHTGCGLSQIFKYASLNPAKLLGIDNEIGSIEAGKKANMITIDDKINVDKVIFEGESVV